MLVAHTYGGRCITLACSPHCFNCSSNGNFTCWSLKTGKGTLSDIFSTESFLQLMLAQGRSTQWNLVMTVQPSYIRQENTFIISNICFKCAHQHREKKEKHLRSGLCEWNASMMPPSDRPEKGLLSILMALWQLVVTAHEQTQFAPSLICNCTIVITWHRHAASRPAKPSHRPRTACASRIRSLKFLLASIWHFRYQNIYIYVL